MSSSTPVCETHKGDLRWVARPDQLPLRCACHLPLQILAPGAHHVVLHHPSVGCCTTIAVQVHRTPQEGWEVQLLPGLRLVNQLPGGVCCHISSGMQQSQREVVEVAGGGGSTSLQLLEATVEAPLHRPGELRLWLGSSAGWSQALPLRLLHAQALVEVLRPESGGKRGRPAGPGPGPASHGLAPPAGAERQLQAPAGAVLAQVLAPDAATGQAAVVLCHPAVLRNCLPCSIFLTLPTALLAGNRAPQQQQPRVEVQPGAAVPLAVLPQGGELLRVALSAEASPSLPVVAPALASPDDAEAVDASAAAFSAAAASTADALFLPPPGQAALVHLAGCPAPGPFGARSTVAVLLLTEQQRADLPLLHIRLVPLAVAQSCLQVAVQLHLPGCTPVEVPPSGRVLLDWQGQAARPRDAAVEVLAPAHHPGSEGSLGQQVALRSQQFSLEGSSDAHLVLSSQRRGASLSGGSLFSRRSSALGFEAGGGQLECRLAVRVDVSSLGGGLRAMLPEVPLSLSLAARYQPLLSLLTPRCELCSSSELGRQHDLLHPTGGWPCLLPADAAASCAGGLP